MKISSNLATQIHGLNARDLQLLKRQLQALPEDRRRVAYGNLQGIPELSDILGVSPARINQQATQPTQPKVPVTGDLPLWQKGLQGVGNVADWFKQHIDVPVAATLAAPFTPGLAGGRNPNESALGYSRRQYEQWQAPKYVKGVLELAPTVAGTALGVGLAGTGAKLGATAAGKAASAAGFALNPSATVAKGALAKAAVQSGKGAGKAIYGGLAKALTPLAEVEAIPGKILGGIPPKTSAKIAEEAAGVPMPNAVKAQRLAEMGKGAPGFSKQVIPGGEALVYRNAGGEPIAVAHINYSATGLPVVSLVAAEGKSLIIGKAAKAFEVELVKIGATLPDQIEMTPAGRKIAQHFQDRMGATLPPKAPLVSTLTPEQKLAKAIRGTKPITAETARLQQEEYAKRGVAYEARIGELRAQGISGEEAINTARKETGHLSTAYPTSDKVGQGLVRAELNDADWEQLYNKVADHNFVGDPQGFQRSNTNLALDNLRTGVGVQRNQITLLEDVFGKDVAGALLSKMTRAQKIELQIVDALNAPRTALTIADLSGFLRQGAILAARHPIKAGAAFRRMLDATVSDAGAALQHEIIMSRPGMAEAIQNGLAYTKLGSQVSARGALTKTEEGFASGFMNRLGIVKASNRAYTTVLNDLRSIAYLDAKTGWEKAGVKFGDADIKELARLVNWASGRGDLPGSLGQHSGAISAILFAPKLMMSHLQFPTAIFPWVNKSALVRQEATKQMLSFLGAGAGILSMAVMAKQGTVELDPRSPDFGKLKVGDTRLDIWSGYAQYMRLAAQMVTAQGKSESGRISGKDRADLIQKFVQAKLSPAMGLLNDIVQGETYLGEELPPKSVKGVAGQIYQRLTPLAIQDIVDGWTGQGIHGAILGTAGTLGVGVATYIDDVKLAENKAAQIKYGMSFDEVGQKLGRATQLELMQTTPKIVEAQKARDEQSVGSKPSVMKSYQSQGKSIEQTYRDAVNQAAKNFRKGRNGAEFKAAVDDASKVRREMYGARAKQPEYADIQAYYDAPPSPQQLVTMNPLDVARAEYNQKMYAANMYDPETGKYLFDAAQQEEDKFVRKYGQQALEYVQNYSNSSWVDKPVELRALEQAKTMLQPYFAINNQVWSMYSPELKTASDMILLMEKTDPDRARLFLRRYPQILRARELIARQKKRMRESNPTLKLVYATYYGQ